MAKTVGDALKSERETRGVTLEQIARDTHLIMRYLKALEDEDLGVLPAPFYARYYMKNYLRSLGVDAEAFFSTHSEHMARLFPEADAEASQQVMEKIQYARFRKGKWIAAFLALAAAAAGIALFRPWSLLGGGGRPRESALLAPGTADELMTDPAFSPDFDPVAVSISLQGSSWISAARGNEKVAERLFTRGETLSLGGYRLTMYIGNPQAVSLTVNGRELPQLRGRKEPLRLTLTPQILAELFKGS